MGFGDFWKGTCCLGRVERKMGMECRRFVVSLRLGGCCKIRHMKK
jgi:hypothetical protein